MPLEARSMRVRADRSRRANVDVDVSGENARILEDKISSTDRGVEFEAAARLFGKTFSS